MKLPANCIVGEGRKKWVRFVELAARASGLGHKPKQRLTFRETVYRNVYLVDNSFRGGLYLTRMS